MRKLCAHLTHVKTAIHVPTMSRPRLAVLRACALALAAYLRVPPPYSDSNHNPAGGAAASVVAAVLAVISIEAVKSWRRRRRRLP